MKLLFAFIGVLLFALMMKPQCSRDQAKENCKYVCADNGWDAEGSVQTGFFTITCKCKTPPKKKVQVYPRS